MKFKQLINIKHLVLSLADSNKQQQFCKMPFYKAVGVLYIVPWISGHPRMEFSPDGKIKGTCEAQSSGYVNFTLVSLQVCNVSKQCLAKPDTKGIQFSESFGIWQLKNMIEGTA